MRLQTYLLKTLLSVATLTNASATKPTATIDGGVIIGTTTAIPSTPAKVNQFLGVPFAAPPKRFFPPQRYQSWKQPLKTQKKKAACIQEFAFAEPAKSLTLNLFNNPPPEESEDCLYLNVYVPSTPAPKGGRAVMFWIYGGGLYFGDASHAAYDGSHFAAFEDVILVATNYRTNVFGFPSAPEIPLQSRNLGFLDQRLALTWVQQNIHAFGGDPKKVTIFGESAGSFSVDALLTSYNSTAVPPFRAAILESGQLSYRGAPDVGKPYPSSAATWEALAAGLDCRGGESNFSCVAGASAENIKAVMEREFLYFWPAYDERTLYVDGAGRRKRGEIARVPILSGSNADEGRFIAYGQSNLTDHLAQVLGEGLTPELVEKVEREYPVGGEEFPTTFDALAAIDTDVSFQCAEALVANETAGVGTPSWRYYFNASFPNVEGFPDSRAYHSVELYSVFSTYPTNGSTAAQRSLSTLMRGAWAKFAKDPENGPGWQAIDVKKPGTPNVAVFSADHPNSVKLVKQSEVDRRCSFWADILAGKY